MSETMSTSEALAFRRGAEAARAHIAEHWRLACCYDCAKKILATNLPEPPVAEPQSDHGPLMSQQMSAAPPAKEERERIRRAINAVCECGGGGPGECCLACEVWHAYKRGDHIPPAKERDRG